MEILLHSYRSFRQTSIRSAEATTKISNMKKNGCKTKVPHIYLSNLSLLGCYDLYLGIC